MLSGVLAGVLGGIPGCTGDTTGPAPLPPVQTFWSLRLNYHAVNMAVSDTVRLMATAFNAAGDTLTRTGLGTVTYKAGDSTVSVSPTGLVTARFKSLNINRATNVIATLTDTVRHVTHRDTVFILVTLTRPSASLDSFSIQPATGDSAKRSMTSPNYTVKIKAKNTSGGVVNFVSGAGALVAYFSVSDPTYATINRSSGAATLRQPGLVTFYATTLAYGVVKQDSLRFVIGYATEAAMGPNLVASSTSLAPVVSFGPSVLIATSGRIDFLALPDGDSLDIEFDDSALVQDGGCFAQRCDIYPSLDSADGNIKSWATDTTQSPAVWFYTRARYRKFPIAGTYYFHSRRYPGALGTIVVRDDPHY